MFRATNRWLATLARAGSSTLVLAAAACSGGDELAAPSQAPARIEKAAGDAQNASAGTGVETPPAVKVLGRTGGAVAGVRVTFQVVEGDGTVTPAAVETDASGVAAVSSWTLGPAPGPNQLAASVSGSAVSGNPVIFTATGVVGNANKLVFVVQPSNTIVGSPITPPVKVQVQDVAGNPVTSAVDTITITLGNATNTASLAGVTSVKATNGTATFSDLSVGTGGTGYTLIAQGRGLVRATSAAFNVVTGESATAITGITPASSVVGQPYDVTFTVGAVAPASGTPSGTVTVSDGTGATCTTSAPSGSCALTSTTAGTKSVVATYVGDANFAASTSKATSHQVNAAATTVMITNAPATAFFGQPITVQFTVTVNPPGAGTPVGTVTVTYGNSGGCTAPVTAGKCSFTPTAAGTGSLQAVFTPSTADFVTDQSPTVSYTVNRATTTTAVSSSKNPADEGESVTFTAVVAVANGQGTPTGTVAFRDGDATLATVPLSGNGSATTSSSFTAGQHNITAQYSGDSNFAGSTSAVLEQQVNTPASP